SSVDPLDFFSDPGPAASLPQKRAGAEPDHIPAEAEFFPPPRVEREHSMHAEATHAEGPRADVRSHARPSPASTSDTGSGAFIPEDWDRTGFSMPAGDAPEPEPGGDDFFGATLAPGGGARSAAPITDAGGLSADAAL